MRLLAIAVAAALAACAASPADAQTVKKKTVRTTAPVVRSLPPAGSTYIMSRDEQGRTRTKLLVQKRSYLDGGTEVMPGDVSTHQTQFIDSYYYGSSRSLVPNDSVVPGRPINDPFFLPGKNNPFFN